MLEYLNTFCSDAFLLIIEFNDNEGIFVTLNDTLIGLLYFFNLLSFRNKIMLANWLNCLCIIICVL